MVFPFYVTYWFTLVAFNIFFLYLTCQFVMCLSVFLLEFFLLLFFFFIRNSLASWNWVTVSFTKLENFSAIISSNIFVRPFPFLLFFWDPYNANIGAINVSVVSETVLISFHFFLNFILWQWLPALCLPAHLLVLLTHLFC